MMKCIGMKKYTPCKTKKKEIGVIILISKKVEFKIKSIIRDNKGYFLNIKRLISLRMYTK